MSSVQQVGIIRYWGNEIADLGGLKAKLSERAMTKKDADPDQPSGRRYRVSMGGFLPVARVFLRTYSHLRPRVDRTARKTGLAERVGPHHAMLVLHVLDGLFENVARVKYGILATRMGKSLKFVQDLVAQMVAMRNKRDEPYLKVVHDRVEGDSIFDFSGLFHAIIDMVEKRVEHLNEADVLKSPETDPPPGRRRVHG